MPGPWVWETRSRRYRDTATGRFIGARDMVALRDRFIDAQCARMRDLAAAHARGDLDVLAWQDAMRQEIKTTLIDEYVLGRGGRGSMTPSDWGRLGAMARRQYTYLQGFANDLAAGRYVDAEGLVREDAIAQRAILYMHAGRASYERAHARAYGVPALPAYPGEDCLGLTNCRCTWDIVPIADGWECTWVAMGDATTCEVCGDHAAEWSPLHVAAGPF